MNQNNHCLYVFLALVIIYQLSSVKANCGCLKCSKHLDAVDVQGPKIPIKVIFKRPTLCSCTSSFVCNQCPCKESTHSYCTGQQYTPLIQIPQPGTPKPTKPLPNLFYWTDRILVPPQKCHCSEPNRDTIPTTCDCQQCSQSPIPCVRRRRDLSTNNYGYNALMRTRKPSSRKIHDLKHPTTRQLDNRRQINFKKQSPTITKLKFTTTVPFTQRQGNFAKKSSSETTLLKKLKKLNNNPFNRNLEDQATTFMRSLMKPRRQKRTIIFGSDELRDLPPSYKVDFVSAESSEDEDSLKYSEEVLAQHGSEEPSLVVGQRSPFRWLPMNQRISSEYEDSMEEDVLHQAPRPLSPIVGRRKPISWLPTKGPDVLVGKNVIQKAVRDELDAYHKKLDKEKKLQELKANLQRKNQPVVPQSPIHMLLTAPMHFLKQLQGSKSSNPVLTSLPKMVYVAKKYLKDFGQNFQKHCLHLASNIIGDFDNVNPKIIQQIRHKRDVKSMRNFRKPSENHARKKRYIIKIVDDDQAHEEIEDYVAQKMDDKFSFLRPLQDYYNKVTEFFQGWQPPEDDLEDYEHKKKAVIKKVQPRIIIDNKGLPFIEQDGFKRPMLLNLRKKKKHSEPIVYSSEENAGDKITALITRAKEDSEIVGHAQPNELMMPKKIIKDRISALLEEIDQLVHLNAEEYDKIFENLLKVQQIKSSIEQDWKRTLMQDKVDDLHSKVDLLSKIKDLQQIKDESVRNIAEKLTKIDNEFVRKQLVHSLIRLQKLQCLITSVVEYSDQNLQMKTPFNTKKEIKYVDFLSELNFIHAKTRNDLVKKLAQDRDVEAQKTIETLNKLKKLLMKTDEENSEHFQGVAKLLWELKNLCKLEGQTIKDMNRKLTFRQPQKVKKELKILFDLQKRFEECEEELGEALKNVGGTVDGKVTGPGRDILSEIKKRRQEMLEKRKENILKLRARSFR